MDVASLADLLRETAEHHGSFEAVAPPHDWWDWYAAYMDPSLPRSLETASLQRFPAEGVIGDPGVCVNRGAARTRRAVFVVGSAGC